MWSKLAREDVQRDEGNSQRWEFGSEKEVPLRSRVFILRACSWPFGRHAHRRTPSKGEHGSISGGNHQSNAAPTFCFASPSLISQSSFVNALLHASAGLCFKGPSFVHQRPGSLVVTSSFARLAPSLAHPLHILALPLLVFRAEGLRLSPLLLVGLAGGGEYVKKVMPEVRASLRPAGGLHGHSKAGDSSRQRQMGVAATLLALRVGS